jgi:quinol monooxygenase YgiN
MSPVDSAEPRYSGMESETRGTEVTTPTTQHSEEATFPQPEQACCPIVELRQYTLHPGKRDVLIELFDREFIESQEILGMYVIGQFRDLDDPNRFVWLRGFRNTSERAEGLTAFYTGPVWKANREAANATMVDSDNVLLLRPACPGSGFLLENNHRPPPDAKEIPEGLVVGTIYYLDALAGDDFVNFFELTLKPVLMDTGASVLAYFVTESSANNFPALPVREGENVFVCFSGFRDEAAYEDHLAALLRSQHWRTEVSQELTGRLKKIPEVLRLTPTARSQLRC